MAVEINQRYRFRIPETTTSVAAEVTAKVKSLYPQGGPGGPMVAECIIETVHSSEKQQSGRQTKQPHYVGQPWGVYVSELEQMTAL